MTEQEASYHDNLDLWLKLALKELKDKPITDLNWKNSTGLEFQPYYSHAEKTNRFPAFNTKTGTEWDMVEWLEVKDEKLANKQALEALNVGVSCLTFRIHQANGLNWSSLLQDIELGYIALVFECSVPQWQMLVQGFTSYCTSKGIKTEDCLLFLQDIPELYPSGADWAVGLKGALSESKAVEKLLPHIQINWVNSAFLGHAGLNAEMELAIMLALRNFMLENECKDSAYYRVGLSVATDYYTELAKFRIAPALLKLISDKYQNENQPYIHASINKAMISHLDPYTNVLRMGTAAMSAVLGGCNALQMHSFDPYSEDNTEFIQRITRNVQLVLLHESGIAEANDPAAGAAFFEEMCFQLSEQVWERFLYIEQQGGLIAYLDSGDLDHYLKNLKSKKWEAVQAGQQFLLGVNKFRDKNENSAPIEAQNGIFSVQPWSLAMQNQSNTGGKP